MKVTVVIPVYNERSEVLQSTIDDLHFSMKRSKANDYEIIAVNDGSKSKYDYSRIKNAKVIAHRVNKGYGASIKTGIKEAKYEWIAITDADGTYPNKVLHELLEYCGNYDMVVGKRDPKGVPTVRRFPKFVLRTLASFLAGRNIPDLNSGLRVFRKELALNFWKLFPQGFSLTSTITMAAITNGYEVKFIPIPYYRRAGKSHIKPIADTSRFLQLIIRLALYFNPLRFFMPLSLAFLGMALTRGIRDYIVTDKLGGLTLVLFFMAFQTFFFGLLAEIVSRK